MTSLLPIFDFWPTLVIFAIAFAIFSLPLPFWKKIDVIENGPNRIKTIDGIRGYLAMAVMVHHGVIRIDQMQTGQWELPPSMVYSLLGQLSVGMFFAITGYLFWQRISNRTLSLGDWVKFYVNRCFRIVPLYWVLVTVYVVYVLVVIHFDLRLVPARETLGNFLGWVTFGLLHHRGWLYNISDAIQVIPQTWTLWFEWIFYFSLPFLALFARRRGAFVLCVVVFLAVNRMDWLATKMTVAISAYFLCGFIAAGLQKAYPRVMGPSLWKDIAVVLLLGMTFRHFGTAYQPDPTLLIGAAFVLIASGSTIFGLLNAKASQRLGHVSYGIYLLQSIPMTILTAPGTFGARVTQSFGTAWLTIGVGSILTVLLACVTYRLVEQPGIALGKRLSQRMGRAWESNHPGQNSAIDTSRG